jgi:hypothetical protein
MIAVTDPTFSHRRWLWRAALILCAATNLAAAGSNPSLQNLIAQLGSDNPQLRDEARVQLMALPPESLPALRSAALSLTPLLPGQIAELRDIVTQVYLAGDDYKKDPASPQGFLGLYWPPPDPTKPMPSGDGTVTVIGRIAGFPAYRVLKPGDIITQVLEYPQTPMHDVNDFTNIIKLLRSGDVVHLNIIRSGRPMTVALTLAMFPVELDQHRNDTSGHWIDNWMLQRGQRADDYWKREFSPIDRAETSTRQETTAVQP